MNLDKIVCECMSVTVGMVKEAVANGATTLEDVQNEIGAGTACGVCVDDIQRLIDYFSTERDS